MPNERKTENIVRNHFRKYADEIVIEEQQSSNPRIRKLLSLASKGGTGRGYPEFIIQYKDNPDLLIVIECKASPKKHESNDRTNPKKYAVDGSLLYSSYLSKEFDVISIGVSGSNKNELKVSHHLQLKKDNNVNGTFGDKLLTPSSYFEGYRTSPEKFRQDYEKLLEFSKKLNEDLHAEKIVESDRALLLSCIIVALENKSFEKTYKEYSSPKQLAEYLVVTTKNEFEFSNLSPSKVKVLINRFSFIKTDTSLSKKEGVLKDIITDVKDNIKNFVKTHQYYDVLGQLYIEFLRYANSDKGLGVVLTPRHLTEFMVKIVDINKNNIIYDNCAGTGGFLVSAMREMIRDAGGDQTKIEQIKSEQIVGVEYQAHIFALACSNMFIHQDGKSSIMNGSCFDEEIIDQVKEYKPNVGLLNPPYKSNKKRDTDEFEYIINNLQCLQQGGKCAAIVPMKLALAQDGKDYEFKKRILKEHTLEGVFSMPDELFFNSNVSTVTCVMVFTAKKPHPKNKKTYFGYYKKDGFVKRKHKGRVDLYQIFEKKVKDKWINTFRNLDQIPGFSVKKNVNASDEWCAEAYMQTDYSNINKSEFVKNIKEYLAYKIVNSEWFDEPEARSKPVLNYKIKLNTQDWKWFTYPQLFELKKGKRLTQAKMEKGETPFIGSSDSNNGLTAKIARSPIHKGNVLTVNYDGSVGKSFYQPIPFWALDSVNVLYPKFEFNAFRAMFLITLIEKERYRFNYGRKWHLNRMKRSRIKLPTDKNNKPDWEEMEKFIKTLPYSSSLDE